MGLMSIHPHLCNVHSVTEHMCIEHQPSAWPCVQRRGTSMNKNNKVVVFRCLTREVTDISLMFKGRQAPVRNAWVALIIS